MNYCEIWIWIIVGLLPYRVKLRNLAGGVRTLEARALFWSLTVRLRRSGRHDFVVHIPLIEDLRSRLNGFLMHDLLRKRSNLDT